MVAFIEPPATDPRGTRCWCAVFVVLAKSVFALVSESTSVGDGFAKILARHVGGPVPPARWAARIFEVVNRDLAPGRKSPLAVIRGLLDEDARRSLLEYFDQEQKGGRSTGSHGQEVPLGADHPAARAVREAVARAAAQVIQVPLYHELSIVRRYSGQYTAFPRHCDNADAPVETVCNVEYTSCSAHLLSSGLCSRGVHATTSNLTVLRRHFPKAGALGTKLCHRMPLRCVHYACARSHLGCASLTSWPEGVYGRLPRRHALFRVASVSLQLDGTFEGGDLGFWSADGADYWPSPELKPGDAVLFDAGVPHAVSPVTRGNRTVLLHWFHSEPWGADLSSPVQIAYEAHVKGLTNDAYEGGEAGAKLNAALKTELYKALERHAELGPFDTEEKTTTSHSLD